ncbi:TPA: hypothetical protein ACS1FU_003078 [Klebsiella aerogenes]
MKNGIYKVIFNSNVNKNGNCDGIVTINDGHLNGGDYVCYYKGVFEGNNIKLNVVRHNPHDTTVFNGLDDVVLDLIVNEMAGGGVFNGKVVGKSELTISGSLQFLSEIS